MTDKKIKEIMETMGWTDGSFIPIANEENMKLLNKLQANQSDLVTKTELRERLKDRTSKIQQHTTAAQLSINQNMKLISAHQEQLSSENHMFKLAERDDSSIHKQLRELKKTALETDKHNELTQDEINKVTDRVVNKSQKIRGLKQLQAAWEAAANRVDLTNKLIEKYCQHDQQKAENLTVKRQGIEISIQKERKKLLHMYEDQKALEQNLGRTAQLYRQAHQDRQQMIETWKEAVKTMNSREQDIIQSEKDIDDMKELNRIKDQELKAQNQFLNEQLQNNRETEAAIAVLNETMGHSRTELTNLVDTVATQSSELITQKKFLHNMANRLQQLRQKNRQNTQGREEKTRQREQNNVMLDKLKQKLDQFKQKNLNAQERLKYLDELIESEQKSITKIANETSRLSGSLYRSQQALHDLQNQDKILHVDESTTENTTSQIRSGFTRQNKEIIRLTEIVYNMDIKLADLEMRIRKMKGSAVDIVDPEVEARLYELHQSFTARKDQQQLVRSQVTRVEDDMRKLNAAIMQDDREMERLDNKRREREIICEGGEVKLKKLTLQYQEHLVEQSLLKMRIHQLERTIERHEKEVYTIEKQRADLEMIMQERLLEINAQKLILQMRRKQLIEEKGMLRADIADRTVKIQAMIARYETAHHLLGRNEDGTPMTALQINIEILQERQMLLDDGNRLNEKIIAAEKDVKAIENTLALLNYSNDSYRVALDKDREAVDEEHKQFIELNNRYTNVAAKRKMDQHQLVEKQKEMEELNEQRDSLERQYSDVIRYRMENNDTLMKVHKEVLEQNSKMERAKREFKLARKMVKERIPLDYLDNFEKDLLTKELEERNSSALQQLADMVDAIIGIGPIITKHLTEKGLTVPTRRLTDVSFSVCDTTRSTFTSKSTPSRTSISSICGSRLSLTSSTSGSSKIGGFGKRVPGMSKTPSVIDDSPSSSVPTIVSIQFPAADMLSTRSIKSVSDDSLSVRSTKSQKK